MSAFVTGLLTQQGGGGFVLRDISTPPHGLLPCRMTWLIPLTEWQAEVAQRAIQILARDNPAALAGFVLSERTLMTPDDMASRKTFVQRGVWKVEFALDAMVEDGEITRQQKATLRKSMLSLEDKIENPEHARTKRA